MGKKEYRVLGLMSGSSLDGLDLAYCKITWSKDTVLDWELIHAETLPYKDQWVGRLKGLPEQNALIYAKTNVYFGYYMAELVEEFIQKHDIAKQDIDFIASHGHTIFHQPERRISVQIGDGAAIAAETGITTITDFRSQDVALDGEGAPLAPIVERYLFGEHNFYLNIGGIANLSSNLGNKWLAGDVCGANQILNFLSIPLGAVYDKGGEFAREGKVNWDLLEEVSSSEFYTRRFPRSIGNGWLRHKVAPIYKHADLEQKDKLATATEHVAQEIKRVLRGLIRDAKKREVKIPNSLELFVTGGGVYNAYLMERIAAYVQSIEGHEVKVVFPDAEIIEFKEALLMAMLGVLRMEGKANSWKTVTGAKRDTINGAVFLG